ncbi:MAG: HD domain-containing protein [Clostridia bacterium]|nr:HD domain-containing protein [Clostridia bacterium]
MNSFSHYHGKLAQKLTPKRYQHSVAVAETSLALAKIHNIHSGLAYLAGLLHDYARDLPDPILAELAKRAGIPSDPILDALPELWHGSVGAFLVQKELGLKHPALLQAINNHILGHPQMTELDKIVFLADMIEPSRDFPAVDQIREKAFQDLNEAMILAFEQSIYYLLDKKQLIHPLVIEARNKMILDARLEGR